MDQITITKAEQDIELIKAKNLIIEHIRTDKYLYEASEIIKEIEGALFERNEIADEKSRDYANDGEVDF